MQVWRQANEPPRHYYFNHQAAARLFSSAADIIITRDAARGKEKIARQHAGISAAALQRGLYHHSACQSRFSR